MKTKQKEPTRKELDKMYPRSDIEEQAVKNIKTKKTGACWILHMWNKEPCPGASGGMETGCKSITAAYKEIRRWQHAFANIRLDLITEGEPDRPSVFRQPSLEKAP